MRIHLLAILGSAIFSTLLAFPTDPPVTCPLDLPTYDSPTTESLLLTNNNNTADNNMLVRVAVEGTAVVDMVWLQPTHPLSLPSLSSLLHATQLDVCQHIWREGPVTAIKVGYIHEGDDGLVFYAFSKKDQIMNWITMSNAIVGFVKLMVKAQKNMEASFDVMSQEVVVGAGCIGRSCRGPRVVEVDGATE
ncbi:uncharacterized protein KY384_007484 [Bacidia gigantensis]|uniref:uncharacterized protein n=1 Tax=Bacidia gigantensis TaxID=2732470 RepID=UPI001D057173|nr:uncharacterized protein KY384_007484 [Bacidia gigantensis]KAG8527332.1 hypothetical protein KY384_007484 [Bacidia gigantensis]